MGKDWVRKDLQEVRQEGNEAVCMGWNQGPRREVASLPVERARETPANSSQVMEHLERDFFL